jgi:hypothetical protein
LFAVFTLVIVVFAGIAFAIHGLGKGSIKFIEVEVVVRVDAALIVTIVPVAVTVIPLPLAVAELFKLIVVPLIPVIIVLAGIFVPLIFCPTARDVALETVIELLPLVVVAVVETLLYGDMEVITVPVLIPLALIV